MRRDLESWRLTTISWRPLGWRALRSHITWAHPRGITPLTYNQHSRWSKSLPHPPSCRADYSSTHLCWPHHRSLYTSRMETTQPGAIWWDQWSGWTSGCFPNPGKSIHQWRCYLVSCLPHVHQRGDIDLVRWNPSKVHRQLWHSCRAFQCAICNQLVSLYDICLTGQSATSRWWISPQIHW